MFSGTPTNYKEEALINDGFWPDLNLADFQQQRNIPLDIDAQTVAQALVTATGEVNEALATVKSGLVSKGHNQAKDVPGVVMAGENLLCSRYKKAVFSRAKADLLGEFASIGRRESHPGQESTETRDGLLAEGSMVLRAIKGLKRVTVRQI